MPCIIRPQDFSQIVTDSNYRTWTVGPMRHVIAALDGQPVAITIDKMTGSTRIGVKLVRIQGSRGGGGYDVILEDKFGNHAFSLFSLGEAILPLVEETVASKDAKWVALDSFREEKSAATRRAQEEHGDGRYGKWSAAPGYADVTVSFEPQTGGAPADANQGEKGRFNYWRYSVADLKAEARS